MPLSLRSRIILLLACCCSLTPLRSDDTVAADLATAQSLFNERRYAEAQPLFESVLARSPDHLQALKFLGKLAAKRRERELAVHYLARAVELAPDDPEMRFEHGAACGLYAGTLGTSLSALRYARRGRKDLETAVELAPENLMYRQALIEFYTSAPMIAGGSMRKAYEQADAIAAVDADQGAFARANLQRVEQDWAGAIATFNGVLQRSPDNYFALFEIGRCAAESGLELESGLRALRRCLELPAPDQGAPPAYVWWRLGQIQHHQGATEDARISFEKALQLQPGETRIQASLAALDSAVQDA